ncbi:type III secretion system export apparatus subunit SctS [Paraburkholderia bonniea]|uniref:type III secretion system export apparatus subunit SctS n=1 Tax=Paraburkholderia bonniea TaxID=2152891 RepID=UPI001291C48B|nr:type III secretion system export apparatus subunit SctS [Paraburkholderia bonniea]WJF89302.1 type III secretion system export apparatus subunit SctS [Paraburkholderia bonniea]WJF92618.1 type III secretion system export apparatus subunit SctS [Paraburkholderia bonniea]
MSTPDLTAYLAQMLYLTLLLSLPVILAASAVGVLMAILQALTQIQEQTLPIAIKLIVAGVTLFMTANWMGSEMFMYAISIFDMLPRLGGH